MVRRDYQTSTRLLLLAALLTTAVIVGTILILWPGGVNQDGMEANPFLYEPTDQTDTQGRPEDGSVNSETALAEISSDPGEGIERVALGEEGIRLVLEVADKVSGDPVPAFDFKLRRRGDISWGSVGLLNETVRNGAGIFSTKLDQGGIHDVIIRTRCYRIAVERGIQIPNEPCLIKRRIELDPGESVCGRVVDDETGKPVAKALIVPRGFQHLRYIMGHTEAGPLVLSDADGRFSLGGLKEEELYLAAIHPDFADGVTEALPGIGNEVEIRLPRGFRVYGTVRDDDGQPVAGVAISRWSVVSRVTRFTLSDDDGTYRCGPVIPSRVILEAKEPENKSGTSLGFTHERKQAEVIDQDVRVDFGPSADHVTWMGRLSDPTGLPLDGIVLSARLLKEFSGKTPGILSRRCVCGPEGEFIFRKIFPGGYEVSIKFPGQENFRFSEESFETAGVVVRDLELRYGVIRGQIIDSESGERLIGKKCDVQAWLKHLSNQSYSQNDISDGLFCLRGLLPGHYSLLVSGQEIPTSDLDGILVESGQITDNVSFPILLGGTLHIILMGFEEDDDINVWYRQEGLGWSSGFKSRGDTERSVPVQTGTWLCRFSLYKENEKVGEREYTSTVMSGTTTVLEVTRTDFEPSSVRVAVTGNVAFDDGSPIANAKIILNASVVPGIPDDEKIIEGTTDKNGNYRIEEIRPGRWSVKTIFTFNKESIDLWHDSLTIPETTANPVPFDIIVSLGEITGYVNIDCNTLEILKPISRELVRIWLEHPKTGYHIGVKKWIREAGEGNFPFRLGFVPPGEFVLVIRSPGHSSYRSLPFSISEGARVDLGVITLLPVNGVLFEQVDEMGEPVSGYITFPEYPQRRGTFEEYLSKGRHLFTDLPFGRLKVRAQGQRFKDKDLSVQNQPGTGIQVIRVVMKRE